MRSLDAAMSFAGSIACAAIIFFVFFDSCFPSGPSVLRVPRRGRRPWASLLPLSAKRSSLSGRRSPPLGLPSSFCTGLLRPVTPRVVGATTLPDGVWFCMLMPSSSFQLRWSAGARAPPLSYSRGAAPVATPPHNPANSADRPPHAVARRTPSRRVTPPGPGRSRRHPRAPPPSHDATARSAARRPSRPAQGPPRAPSAPSRASAA